MAEELTILVGTAGQGIMRSSDVASPCLPPAGERGE